MIEPKPAIVKSALSELIARARALNADIDKHELAALQRAIDLGKIVNQIKDTVEHGGYLPAIEKIGLSKQRASEFSRIAKGPTSDLSNFKSLREALRYLSEHPDESQVVETITDEKNAAEIAKHESVFCDRCQRIGQPVRDCPSCQELRRPKKKPDREPGDDKEQEKKDAEQAKRNGRPAFDFKSSVDRHWGPFYRSFDEFGRAFGVLTDPAVQELREDATGLRRKYQQVVTNIMQNFKETP